MHSTDLKGFLSSLSMSALKVFELLSMSTKVPTVFINLKTNILCSPYWLKYGYPFTKAWLGTVLI